MAASAAREKWAGLALIGAAGVALVLANSPLRGAYEAFLHFKLGPPMPGYGVFDVGHWVSEALMAIFFLLVGLEVKREWFEGRLADPQRRRLPVIAAIGGMVIPALVFILFNIGNPAQLRGWAIPAATDIAFAIGVLALLGPRVPAAIKVLLVTIAIVDDVGAVLIIALFYTAKLNVVALGGALGVMAAMALINLLGVRRLWPYVLAFAMMWLLVLASGIHATIAGVAAALTVPLTDDAGGRGPLRRLEHAIHPWVMFGIVPLFGFASAGVALTGGVQMLLQPVALGVMLGLLVGKQAGVLGAIVLADRTGLAPLPAGLTRRQVWGAALLTGIGFTMSLFIGALAFPDDAGAVDVAKIGTLAGSLLSAVAGYAVLRGATKAVDSPADVAESESLFAED